MGNMHKVFKQLVFPGQQKIHQKTFHCNKDEEKKCQTIFHTGWPAKSISNYLVESNQARAIRLLKKNKSNGQINWNCPQINYGKNAGGEIKSGKFIQRVKGTKMKNSNKFIIP